MIPISQCRSQRRHENQRGSVLSCIASHFVDRPFFSVNLAGQPRDKQSVRVVKCRENSHLGHERLLPAAAKSPFDPSVPNASCQRSLAARVIESALPQLGVDS